MTSRRSGKPPTVALAIETDGPGGAEQMLLHLASGLRDRGRRVIAMGPERGSGWLSSAFRERGFEREELRIRRSVDPGAVRALARTLRRLEVDLLHAHEFQLSVYGGAAARLAGIPHVVTLHGSRYHAKRWHRRLALRWSAARARALVAVSEAYAADLRHDLRLPPERVRVIPNGVPGPTGSEEPVRRELGLRPSEPLILSVGNLYPVKGHAVLVEALALLQGSRPDLVWRAAVAGRGGEEERLLTLARERGIDHRFDLLGLRDDVPNLLAAAGVWVMPSLSEGLPLALLEAMLAGVPIVASRVGGIGEVVEDEESALLVPPGDAAGLARALERALTDSTLRVRIAANARRIAMERFTVEAMVQRYEDVYGLSSGGAEGPAQRRRLRSRLRRTTSSLR